MKMGSLKEDFLVEGLQLAFRKWVGCWQEWNTQSKGWQKGEKCRLCPKAGWLKPRLRVDVQSERRLAMGPDFRTEQKWEQMCRTWRALQRSLSFISEAMGSCWNSFSRDCCSPIGWIKPFGRLLEFSVSLVILLNPPDWAADCHRYYPHLLTSRLGPAFTWCNVTSEKGTRA